MYPEMLMCVLTRRIRYSTIACRYSLRIGCMPPGGLNYQTQAYSGRRNYCNISRRVSFTHYDITSHAFNFYCSLTSCRKPKRCANKAESIFGIKVFL